MAWVKPGQKKRFMVGGSACFFQIIEYHNVNYNLFGLGNWPGKAAKMAIDNRPSLGDVVGEANNHIRDNDWTKPKRLQRKRSKGWRMPPSAVYVGRPSKWGNPFIVHKDDKDGNKWVVVREGDPAVNIPFDDKAAALEKAVALFRSYANYYGVPDIDQLAGKDLMCWCPPDSPCHADVLLEIANK